MDLTIDDALEFIGKTQLSFEHEYAGGGLRIGQYWFICLDTMDRDKLRGTAEDPFNHDTWDAVLRALNLLLEN